jgi:hypothetical protein
VDSKAHYYIGDRSGTYTELVYALVLSQDNSLVEEVSYSPSVVARFYAAVGAGYGKFTFPRSVGNGVFSPGIYEGMDLVRTRNNGDLAIRLEVGYSSASYKGHGIDPYYENYAYAVKASTISPAVAILYYFYRGNQLRLYAGAGAAFNISSYSKSVYSLYQVAISTPQNSQFSPQPFWGQFQLKVGAQLSNRLSVEALGGPPAGIDPNLEFFNGASISQFAVRVGYFFNGTH